MMYIRCLEINRWNWIMFTAWLTPAVGLNIFPAETIQDLTWYCKLLKEHSDCCTCSCVAGKHVGYSFGWSHATEQYILDAETGVSHQLRLGSYTSSNVIIISSCVRQQKCQKKEMVQNVYTFFFKQIHHATNLEKESINPSDIHISIPGTQKMDRYIKKH